MLEIGRESTRSHSAENSLWNSYGPVVRQTTQWMILCGLATVRDHITEMCLHKYRGSDEGKVQNCSKLNGIGLFSRQVKFAECTINFSYWNVRTSFAFCKRLFASCNWWSNIPHCDSPNSEHTPLRTVLGVSCGYVCPLVSGYSYM